MKNKQKGITRIEVIVPMAIVGFIVILVLLIINVPDEADPKSYQTICLDGHEYWRADLDFGQVLAPRMTDEGKPVLCGWKKY